MAEHNIRVSGSKKSMESGVRPVLIGVTGASGTIYALKLLELLKDVGQDRHLVMSDAGRLVAEHELGYDGLNSLTALADRTYGIDEIWAPPASGSTSWKAMIIVPCTMGTLGAVANGISHNLIHRAADCFIKEKRPLVLVVRETPLNSVHITNMLKLDRAGATIFPAMPAFYNHPENIDDMTAMLAEHIAEHVGILPERLNSWDGLGI